MGILFSRFHKKIATIEVLNNLDKRIKDIEQYGQNTEQRHKKIVGTLIICSVILYIITAMILYFYFFPAKMCDQLLYITLFLLFPILILFAKNIVSWYYTRKISRNQEKLITMLQEKKKILDEVTETETYKKAKEILMKFAPDQLKITPMLCPQSVIISDSPKLSTTQMIVPSLQTEVELRRRALTSSNFPQNLSINRITQPEIVRITPSQTPSTVYQKSESSLPRPILSQQRSYIDRLIEYVIGDGPNNRYALICRQCDSHNGMALKEEFEYFAFRCCYCNFWNPARKQKPSAPKLEFDNNLVTPQKLSLQINKSVDNLLDISNENEIISNLSDTDSDIEVVAQSYPIAENEEDKLKNSINNDIEIPEPCFSRVLESSKALSLV
ncbi:PREDICTED: protein lunapark isoform X2 [Ceratosolen solmsi marchali]|uniref:Endoplasmic reticulum junction formation protein lunapark n=1 Tax=Ceratosolen solmsi marchali TaxID=326594 RepID=A0AAJ6YSW0_9HYME|nr:PREDICTED: protein lunapark isoform X2 [Ceratosolen solmsi marchali]